MTARPVGRDEAAVREATVEAIVHLNCDPRLLDRTRRATRAAALAARGRRRHHRRNLAAIFAALMTIIFLVSPEIWNGVEALAPGDRFSSFSVEVSLYILLLFPAMMAALVLIWKGQGRLRHSHDS